MWVLLEVSQQVFVISRPLPFPLTSFSIIPIASSPTMSPPLSSLDGDRGLQDSRKVVEVSDGGESDFW